MSSDKEQDKAAMADAVEWLAARHGRENVQRVMLEIAGQMADHQAKMAQFAKDNDVAAALEFLNSQRVVTGLTEEFVADHLAELRKKYGWA
jgi:hypothetical protein